MYGPLPSPTKLQGRGWLDDSEQDWLFDSTTTNDSFLDGILVFQRQ